MRCIICDKNDWQNVDQFRLKPEGMCMCKSCGFISYPSKWKSAEEIKAYYRKDYRTPPRVNNWFSGQRKLHYHNAFLADLFKEWKAKNMKPVVSEIGAAYGLFLNFVRNHFPEADVSGTELTLSYRRNAWHEFNINLSEEFDTSKKYDLIASYKVAEHQIDADVLLRQYVECLNDGGYFYISVPTWFSRLSNFGASGFDIEYYYHPNHINVWTKKLSEQVLKKVGLRIVKHNDTYYDDTYLCVRDDSVMNEPRESEDPQAMLDRLGKVQAAGISYMEGRYEEAINLWPDFPDAHTHLYEMRRNELHRAGWETIQSQVLDVAVTSCPNAPEIWNMAADLHMRYDKFEDAIKCLEKSLKLRPGTPASLRSLANCYRALAQRALLDRKTSVADAHYSQAREISRYLGQISDEEKWNAVTAVYDDNSRIPTPHEMKI